MPYLGRSSHVKRGMTGRKPKKLKIVRTKVVKHRHRRYRGLHGAPKGTSTRNRAKALKLVEERRKARSAARKPPIRGAKRVFKGRVYKGRKVKPGLKRRFLGRKKLTYKRAYYGRVVPKGLKRRYFGRVVPKGYKRRYFGRKKVVKGPAISQQSYINMF